MSILDLPADALSTILERMEARYAFRFICSSNRSLSLLKAECVSRAVTEKKRLWARAVLIVSMMFGSTLEVYLSDFIGRHSDELMLWLKGFDRESLLQELRFTGIFLTEANPNHSHRQLATFYRLSLGGHKQAERMGMKRAFDFFVWALHAIPRTKACLETYSVRSILRRRNVACIVRPTAQEAKDGWYVKIDWEARRICKLKPIRKLQTGRMVYCDRTEHKLLIFRALNQYDNCIVVCDDRCQVQFCIVYLTIADLAYNVNIGYIEMLLNMLSEGVERVDGSVSFMRPLNVTRSRLYSSPTKYDAELKAMLLRHPAIKSRMTGSLPSSYTFRFSSYSPPTWEIE